MSQWKKTGRAYCGLACSTKYRAAVSSETAAKTNRTHARQRMLERNPMRVESSRQKMTETLRKIWHRPAQRGGNGALPPMAEQVLTEMLRPYGFVPQCVVKTGASAGSGLPRSYKVDAGNPTVRLAVEADGPSHAGKRLVLDQKRDRCLSGLGWTTLRFSNEEILSSPWTVLSTTLKSMGCTPTSPTT